MTDPHQQHRKRKPVDQPEGGDVDPFCFSWDTHKFHFDTRASWRDLQQVFESDVFPELPTSRLKRHKASHAVQYSDPRLDSRDRDRAVHEFQDLVVRSFEEDSEDSDVQARDLTLNVCIVNSVKCPNSSRPQCNFLRLALVLPAPICQALLSATRAWSVAYSWESHALYRTAQDDVDVKGFEDGEAGEAEGQGQDLGLDVLATVCTTILSARDPCEWYKFAADWPGSGSVVASIVCYV